MPNTFNTAMLFLVTTLFDLYLFILLIRLILAWIRANYFNPLVQFVTKLSDFVVKPLRRVIPNVGRVETATLLLIFLVSCLKYLCIILVSYGGMPNLLGIFILALGNIIKLFLDTFFYAILFQVILSWLQPFNPMTTILTQFTAPIMRPFQRVIPPIGGFDISPIPALILLQLLSILLVQPINIIGFKLAIG